MSSSLARISKWIAIALAVSIPISTAMDNLLMVILPIIVLITNAADVKKVVLHNTVARAGILLFIMLIVGMLYGDVHLKHSASSLAKYADLAFMPFLLVVFRDELTRRRALMVFIYAMSATAFLSWLVGLKLVPPQSWMWRGCIADNPAIFRSSITQNIIMAYAAYLSILLALAESNTKRRYLLGALSVLMTGDILFMVNSRTGYLVLFVLFTILVWKGLASRLRRGGTGSFRRGMLAALLLTSVFMLVSYWAIPRIHDRVDEAVKEYQAWKPGVPRVATAEDENSIGSRLEFYNNSISIIERHPILGVGTGGFEAAYEQQARSKGMVATRNPHNEYLLITIQIGAVGLALMLFLFYSQWKYSASLPTELERFCALGIVLTLVTASFFISPLHDHTEGLFYAFMSALCFSRLPTS